jgi:hypothetical protein
VCTSSVFCKKYKDDERHYSSEKQDCKVQTLL